jgi:ABC-type transporter Mla maintaining outer membrane lipid asymmetry permease subunit MlaE
MPDNHTMPPQRHFQVDPNEGLLRETRDKVIETATRVARIELDVVELKAQSFRETAQIRQNIDDLRSFRTQVLAVSSALGAIGGAVVSFLSSWLVKHFGGPPHA